MTTLDRKIGREIFGEDPARYDHGRPGYPPRVFALLKEICGAGLSTNAFEIGAGTGQATRPLVDLGISSLSVVEPDSRLTKFLSQSLGPSRCDRVRLLASTFEDAALPDASFDLGIAATSFHWLDAVPALSKIKRLLRPGGWWAMWWNVFFDPLNPDAFALATEPLFASLAHTPSHTDKGSRHSALDIDIRISELTAAGFESVHCETIRWTTVLDTEQIVALVSTFSPVASLAAPVRSHFLAELRHIADEQFNGSVQRSFLTAFYATMRPMR